MIGLAIKVYDPEHLLGDDETVGVTCVMVPHDLPGVHSGTRHLPMNTVFMNGPTWGNDVFIPMDQVIGGQDMLGKGWTMLLECLSIGRSISLPALAAGAGKVASLATGSYACVREQFGRSISEFEGVQEALEPVAGYSYMMDAARLLTTSMLDRGVRPAVPSALLKYRNTDLMRSGDQPRHGRGGRARRHYGAAQFHGAHLPGCTYRHHGGGGQYPHPQPDGLRPGRHPLPSLYRR